MPITTKRPLPALVTKYALRRAARDLGHETALDTYLASLPAADRADYADADQLASADPRFQPGVSGYPLSAAQRDALLRRADDYQKGLRA